MKDIHEACRPISWLCGQWYTEEGKGVYPNIPEFGYHEELEFVCVGQPMFNYISSSRHPVTQLPMHQERGFLRIQPGTNNLAFVVSHNMGLNTVEEGIYDDVNKSIVLETGNIARMSFAKTPHATKIKRVIKYLSEDSIEVTVSMATDTTPLTEHLKAVYKRKSSDSV